MMAAFESFLDGSGSISMHDIIAFSVVALLSENHVLTVVCVLKLLNMKD
jgi:hypothetical protein